MKTIIVDERITEKCERALLLCGFNLIKLPPDPALPSAVASHPDTVLFYCNKHIITTADYCDAGAYVFSDIREFSPEVKIQFTDDVRTNSYPCDCILNALVIGNKIFCKSDTVSRSVLDYAKAYGYEIVHTNQGYPACSVLSFGNSAITSDLGIASLLQKNGIKTTLISCGGISLPPYDYGFIGGASGVVDKKIYFFGNLDAHPDCERIKEAIISEGFTPVSLSDEELSDFGGIITL